MLLEMLVKSCAEDACGFVVTDGLPAHYVRNASYVHSFAECVRRTTIKEHELKIPTFGRGVGPENLGQSVWLSKNPMRVGKATEEEPGCRQGGRISQLPPKIISLSALDDLGWTRLTAELLDRLGLRLRIWQRRASEAAADNHLTADLLCSVIRISSARTLKV
jgi:hypothetical protein